MTILNVFRQDAFSSLTLTSFIDKNPFMPDGIGELGLFDDLPIYTTALAVENRQGKLVVIPTSPRGAPPTPRVEQKRAVRYFDVPRLAHDDTIYATELQNIREFGTEEQLKSVQTEVAYRLSGPTGLQRSMEYTWEAHRLSALNGYLLDADGSVIFDWFQEFGISRPSITQLNLGGWKTGAATPSSSGDFRIACNNIVRAVARASQGAFTARSRVMCACSDALWDALITHPDVTQTYYNWVEAQELRKGTAFQAYNFGGIDWFNYRGSDDLSAIAIPAGQGYVFPSNAPGIFQRALAPAEFAPWVNTRGKPQYLIPIMDRDRQAWWKMELYSYPLHICTRPETLLSVHA